MVSERKDSFAVSVEGLCGGYGGNSDGFVVKDLSMDIPEGSFTAILGPNGSGKSTFLKHLIKELKAKDGSILLFDEDLASMDRRTLARTIAFEGQNSRCDGDFTVGEVVAMGRFCHGDEGSSHDIVLGSLEKVGMAHLAHRSISRISGGEFQLVMLARALCQDSRILALDEPANNLDPLHQIRLMDILAGLKEEGRTIVCVLHDINAAMRYSTHCAIMKEGGLFAFGRTQDVVTTSSLKEVYGIDARMIKDPAAGRDIVVF